MRLKKVTKAQMMNNGWMSKMMNNNDTVYLVLIEKNKLYCLINL